MPSRETVRDLVDRVVSGELSPDQIAELTDALVPMRADPEILLTRYAAFVERSSFVPGDLVQWKLGLRNKQLPDYGVPAVVVEVFEPLTDTFHGPATPYFRERLDITLGVLDSDDDLVVFHFDSARFERFVPAS